MATINKRTIMSYEHIYDGKERVLTISDMQCPAHHIDSIDFLKECKSVVKPTKIVHGGDAFDFHSLSFYTRNPDLPSIRDEFEQAMVTMRQVYKLFPKATMLKDNHSDRIYRVAEASGLSVKFMRGLLDIMEAPKKWSLEENIVIDGVLYQHGHQGKAGLHPALKQAMEMFQSTVVFHFHAEFGINYFANPSKIIFGMNCGSLLDQKHLAFKYSKAYKKKSIIGTGAVLHGFPVLLPMQLDKHGRWTGKLPKIL
jgi:hypothetical protein